MLMPSKIIKPVDSIIYISAFILKVLKEKGLNVDDLHDKFNEIYYKKISIEQMILGLNFLYIINKIEIQNEIITTKI